MRNHTCRILAQDCLLSNDTWATKINNNDLIIGPSGAGKTRGYVKPNLLQCALQGGESLIIADTKGSLIREIGPVLAAHGYRVLNLDLTDLLNNTVGYNPLEHIRYDPVRRKYSEQDILTLAACLIPLETKNDPFWEQSAQLFLAALIGYVLESLPEEEHTLEYVCRLYQVMDDSQFYKLFRELAEENPRSFAVRTYRMVAGNKAADKAYASIKMFLVKTLIPLTFDGPLHLFQLKERIDFRAWGREETAVFLTISDTDRSMDKLANTFYTQALHILLDSADRDYRPDTRLPVPVRFILDDFATNVVIPDFDNIISVIRSREVYVSLIIQSISQLYSLYGEAKGSTIINNCDNLLYLGGQDIATSEFIHIKADRTMSSILAMDLDDAWVFVRGQPPRQIQKYDLTLHPLYSETPEAGGVPSAEQIDAPGVEPGENGGSGTDAISPDDPDRPLPEFADGSKAVKPHWYELESAQSRKRTIMEKAAKAEALLSGCGQPIRLTDAQGRFSDEAAWELTDTLTSTVAYYFYHAEHLDEKDVTCLRSFFYCALLLAHTAPPWIPGITGTLQDLRTFAQRMKYSSRAKLFYDELYEDAENDNFFSWMDSAYQMLSGLPVTSSISTADRQLVQTQYWREIAWAFDDFRVFSLEELKEKKQLLEDGYKDWQLNQLDRPEREQWILAEERKEEQRREWAAGFAVPEQFCQHYLLFRRLYFDTKLPGILPRLAEQVLDAYLLENSFSNFMEDKVFSAACALLDSTAQRISELLKGTMHS